MATPNRQAPQPPVMALLAQLLPLERTLKDAWKLAARFREAEGFREYLRRRAAFVVPALTLFCLISIACAAATVILLAERHPMLALPAMVLAPFVLVGSFLIEALVFFSWLEGRALAQALGRRGHNKLYFGNMPAVPWVLANATPEEEAGLRATAPRLLGVIQDRVWEPRFARLMAPLYQSTQT